MKAATTDYLRHSLRRDRNELTCSKMNTQQWMHAAWYEKQGIADDVIQLGEMPIPEPGTGDIRVRVHTSGVNPSDSDVSWMTSGKFLENNKRSIGNHAELARLKITSIHVHTPHVHIESTNLPKQILDLTLSGMAKVYHDVAKTENG